MAIRGEMSRMLQEVVISTDRLGRERTERDTEGALLERELQFQLPIRGRAEQLLGWGEIELEFEFEFYYAPAQRDSDLDWPQMTYGYQISSGGPVGVFCCVTGWVVDERTDAVTGCKLAVSAIGDSQDFTGLVHVSFQGYAISRDDFDDTDLNFGTDT
jgi:hypothetical protein